MSSTESASRRRLLVVVNYVFLLVTLVLSLAGHVFGWAPAIIAGFWVSVVIVLASFYPLHIRTGLWRLAHTKVDRMDEREIQQTLQSLRHAYIVFSITTLIMILASVIFSVSGQLLQLVVFWVLLYLAHTLPSSILAWTATRVPARPEE